jgi:hypothetical protein
VCAAALPAAQHDPLLGAAVEAALDCSLAVLAAPAVTTPAAPVAADGSQAAAGAGQRGVSSAAAGGSLLVSSGEGDLLLLRQAHDNSSEWAAIHALVCKVTHV